MDSHACRPSNPSLNGLERLQKTLRFAHQGQTWGHASAESNYYRGAALCEPGRDCGVAVGGGGGVERRREKTPAISQGIVRTPGFMRGRRKPETCNPYDEIFSFRKCTLYFQCKIFKWVSSQCRKTCVAQVKYNSLVAEDKQFVKIGNETRSQWKPQRALSPVLPSRFLLGLDPGFGDPKHGVIWGSCLIKNTLSKIKNKCRYVCRSEKR